MNSPKIYVVQRKNGTYYNHIENFFSSRLSLGSYSPKKYEMEVLIQRKGYVDCEVVEITEQDWANDMATLTTSTVIQIDSLRKKLDEIRYILPTVSGLNKNLKNFLTKTSDHLKKINPIFDDFVREKEDATDEVQGLYMEFIQEVSELEMWDLSEVTAILKARKKDKASIMGITKKVLNKS